MAGLAPSRSCRLLCHLLHARNDRRRELVAAGAYQQQGAALAEGCQGQALLRKGEPAFQGDGGPAIALHLSMARQPSAAS